MDRVRQCQTLLPIKSGVFSEWRCCGGTGWSTWRCCLHALLGVPSVHFRPETFSQGFLWVWGTLCCGAPTACPAVVLAGFGSCKQQIPGHSICKGALCTTGTNGACFVVSRKLFSLTANINVLLGAGSVGGSGRGMLLISDQLYYVVCVS